MNEEVRYVEVRLTKKLVLLIARAILMYSGVPYSRSTRRALSLDEEAVLDNLDGRIDDLVSRINNNEFTGVHTFYMSFTELTLLKEVIAQILEDTSGDDPELELHIGFGRDTVSGFLSTLGRIRR